GTLGRPVSLGVTGDDLERAAYSAAMALTWSGVRRGDVVQLMTTSDRRVAAGLAHFLGLRRLGPGVIRIWAGTPQLQWDSIFENNPKYLITVPSFLLKMLEYAEANGIDYHTSGVKGVVCIGESLRNQDLSNSILCDKILSKWNIELYYTYASPAMSTAFTECEFQNG